MSYGCLRQLIVMSWESCQSKGNLRITCWYSHFRYYEFRVLLVLFRKVVQFFKYRRVKSQSWKYMYYRSGERAVKVLPGQEIVVKVLPFFVSRSSFPVVTCSSLPVVTWSSVFGSCSHSVFGICSQSMFFLVNVLPGIGPGIGFFRVVRIVGCSLVPGSSRVSFRYCSGQLSRVPRIGYWSVSCFPVVVVFPDGKVMDN